MWGKVRHDHFAKQLPYLYLCLKLKSIGSKLTFVKGSDQKDRTL